MIGAGKLKLFVNLCLLQILLYHLYLARKKCVGYREEKKRKNKNIFSSTYEILDCINNNTKVIYGN